MFGDPIPNTRVADLDLVIESIVNGEEMHPARQELLVNARQRYISRIVDEFDIRYDDDARNATWIQMISVMRDMKPEQFRESGIEDKILGASSFHELFLAHAFLLGWSDEYWRGIGGPQDMLAMLFMVSLFGVCQMPDEATAAFEERVSDQAQALSEWLGVQNIMSFHIVN